MTANSVVPFQLFEYRPNENRTWSASADYPHPQLLFHNTSADIENSCGSAIMDGCIRNPHTSGLDQHSYCISSLVSAGMSIG